MYKCTQSNTQSNICINVHKQMYYFTGYSSQSGFLTISDYSVEFEGFEVNKKKTVSDQGSRGKERSRNKHIILQSKLLAVSTIKQTIVPTNSRAL